jgi:hypothetical protein
MPKQSYAITKYSKDVLPNTFRQLQKQSRFKNTTQVYEVVRLRPRVNEYIGHYKSLASTKKAINHHSRKVLKTTTTVTVKLDSGSGYKGISI